MAPQRQLVSVPENVEEGLQVTDQGHSDLLLIQRLVLGLNYIPAITTMSPILRFGFRHVVDLLSPISISMWKSDSTQSWTFSAADGEKFALPSPFPSWIELNKRAILLRQPLAIYIPDPQTREIVHVHWAIPVLLPGESCYVLHLLTTMNEYSKETVETFLTAFAFLLIKCDNDFDRTKKSHKGGTRVEDTSHLTQRQKDILSLSGEGMTYSQIGKKLGFCESTIKQDSMKIFQALGVRNKAEALRSIAPQMH